MARLVSVYEEDKYDFQRRQVPIEVDNMKMVVQFSDSCIDCEKLCRLRKKDLEHFTNKFATLTKDEMAVALLVSGKDILSLLPLVVPCVGCRKSVERLFHQLQKSQHRALEPLVITQRGEVSIQREYLFDPRSLFALFHVHGSKLHSFVEAIPKSKKNKRCNLHSLESHKSRMLGCWLDVWDVMSDSCREKVLVVDIDRLMTTIDSYLDKHKFCTECRSKVLLAYNILIGQHDSSSEKEYCAALYENLRCCAKDRHIHITNDTDFIAELLEKVEPEFIGGKKDRHAKTLDIAQEELLTCLGLHIFERLHQIWQKLRVEEQTWVILFLLGVDALQKSYQTALEKKQGASNLELLCEELQEKEKRRVEKKEIKKQKRKQKKAKVLTSDTSSEILELENPCLCSNVESSSSPKSNNSHHHYLHRHGCKKSCVDSNFNTLTLSLQSCDLHLQSKQSSSGHNPAVISGSGHSLLDMTNVDICESCDLRGSSDCSEEGECICLCTDSIGTCDCDMQRTSGKGLTRCETRFSSVYHRDKPALQPQDKLSLQDLLDELCWVDGDDGDQGISEEEIQAFKAQQVEVESERQKLRQNLRQRFAELQLSKHVNAL